MFKLAAAVALASSILAASLQAPRGRSPGLLPGTTILVYHRFGPAVADAMTVRTTTFRWQLAYLKQHHHAIVPLRTLLSYLRGEAPAPPPGAVVITADDGHRSVFTDMAPLVAEYNVPVTLFIYPSAISNAPYAMTWEQLDALHRTGRFDIQSHTYWHPNFKTESRRLSPGAYRAFAAGQLVKAKTALESNLGVPADLIAWPFGIWDDELIAMAQDAGYVAGFTLDRRMATPSERIMALPRFIVTESGSRQMFTSMLPQSGPKSTRQQRSRHGAAERRTGHRLISEAL